MYVSILPVRQEEWHQCRRVTVDNPDKPGEKMDIDVPVGFWCWACAVALECWGDDKDGTCARYLANDDEEFVSLVNTARQAVVLAKSRLAIERIKAIKNTTYCTKVIRKFMFILASVFAKHFRIPLDAAAHLCTSLLLPDNEYAEGVLVRGRVPPELEWQSDEVHIEISQARYLDQELAGPDTVFRPGQAKDRFYGSVAKVISGRGKPFKSPMTFEELVKKVEHEERLRKEAEAERHR